MKAVDWTKWSAIAEIVSSAAILLTLIYLALQTQQLAIQNEQIVEQTQQNNRFLGAQVVLAQAEFRSRFDERIILSADFADLVVRASNNEELSETDRLRFDRAIQERLSNLEMEYLLQQYTDVIDRESFLATLETTFESESVRVAWEQLKPFRNHDFVSYVEANIQIGDE